jgi:dTDP-glucose 4,6-dehydratase
MNVLVTGGSGFIGSNFLNNYVEKYPNYKFFNYDKLTYAANPLNLKDIEKKPNFQFIRGDICDFDHLIATFNQIDPDIVIHFAAQSHVDRSILSPRDFISTNILGTFNLLEACRICWTNHERKIFHHVSTDEVFGSLGNIGKFSESSAYYPRNPYSASKAGSDHLVRSYFHTFNLPVKITNCSNNYGPYQFPEKFIPLIIINAIRKQKIPVYGDGKNIRDWLFVTDHCDAIWDVITKGRIGETYNIGGNNERTNIEIIQTICKIISDELDENLPSLLNLITFVKDRPGHDYRYAIDSSKLQKELQWAPKESLDSGLQKTVKWYLNNSEWVSSIETNEYRKWIDENYSNRIKEKMSPQANSVMVNL